MPPQPSHNQKDRSFHQNPGYLIIHRDSPGTAAKHAISRPYKIKGYEYDQSHQAHY